MNEIVVVVADVGSASKGNFHWASSVAEDSTSFEPQRLAECIVAHLNLGKRIALGYECPLFMPVPENVTELGKARIGECTAATGNRPFNAGAGASLFATGLQSLVWVLVQIRKLRHATSASTCLTEFRSGIVELLVWEAFVSGREKAIPPSHVGDAKLAIEAFEAAITSESPHSAIANKEVFSLAGAAILYAGLSQDQDLLQQPCLVLRPVAQEVFHGV